MLPISMVQLSCRRLRSMAGAAPVSAGSPFFAVLAIVSSWQAQTVTVTKAPVSRFAATRWAVVVDGRRREARQTTADAAVG